MVFVRERGKAMAAAAAVTETGMTAVLGGDQDTVVSAHRQARPHAGQHQRSRPDRRRRNDGRPRTLPRRPARRRAAAPAAGRRCVPHQAHGASRHRRSPSYARAISTHDARTRLLSNADGTVIQSGREYLKRLVQQVSNPVRWDLCMQTMVELGVTALIEVPPAGTLAGLAKRALPGVEIVALKTPDDFDAARELVAATASRAPSTQHPPGACSWPRPRACSTASTPRSATTSTPVHVIGHVKTNRDEQEIVAPHGGTIVEWLVEDGDPVSPGQPARPPAPARGELLMTPLAPRPGAQHARILGVGAYRPSRVVTNDEICEHIDSSDEWIRERSGIITRHFADADEGVVDMSAAASEKAIAAAGIRADQIDTVIVSTVTHLTQTPSAAAELALPPRHRQRQPHSTSAPRAPGFSYGARDRARPDSRRQCHQRAAGRRRETVRPHRPDRPQHRVHLRRRSWRGGVGPSDVPAIGPVVWGSDGRADRRHHARRLLDDAARRPRPQVPVAADELASRCSAGRSTRCPKSPKQALDAAGITTTDLDVFIPHQANMRITDAMIKKTRPAGVGRRRSRHRRDRQHLGGIHPPGDGAHAGSRARCK